MKAKGKQVASKKEWFKIGLLGIRGHLGRTTVFPFCRADDHASSQRRVAQTNEDLRAIDSI